MTKAQWRRRIAFFVIAAAVVAGLYSGFRTQPVAVDSGVAMRGPLRVTIQQEGRTRVVDRYVVSAPVDAYARRVELDAGDTVKRGDALAYLEPPRAEMLDVRRNAEALARVEAAQDNLNAAEHNAQVARSSAELAQKELARAKALRTGKYVSAEAEDRAAAEAERTASALRSAEFAAATARHALEAERTALEYSGKAGVRKAVIVRSPVNGRVLKIPRISEGVVAAGQALLEIGDPRALEVEVDVLTADAVRLKPGTRVVFERWGGEGVLEGAVRMVEPAGFTKVSALGVEEQRVWVIVSFTSPAAKWQQLGDGYRVEAQFILWEESNVLQVPASALFREGEGWSLFAVQEGRAVKHSVKVGQRNGLSAQILSGVNEGERVIVHPDDRVHDGVKVALR